MSGVTGPSFHRGKQSSRRHCHCALCPRGGMRWLICAANPATVPARQRITKEVRYSFYFELATKLPTITCPLRPRLFSSLRPAEAWLHARANVSVFRGNFMGRAEVHSRRCPLDIFLTNRRQFGDLIFSLRGLK